MGDRGSGSGLSVGGGYGGFGSLQGLIQAANGGVAWAVNTDPNQHGDYDDNGNPALVKYQVQEVPPPPRRAVPLTRAE